MEQWDQDYIDMETEGYFHFGENGLGDFQFGLVRGEIDCRIESIFGKESLGFSWEGAMKTIPLREEVGPPKRMAGLRGKSISIWAMIPGSRLRGSSKQGQGSDKRLRKDAGLFFLKFDGIYPFAAPMPPEEHTIMTGSVLELGHKINNSFIWNSMIKFFFVIPPKASNPRASADLLDSGSPLRPE